VAAFISFVHEYTLHIDLAAGLDKARICREMESESTPGLFVSLVLLILPVALSNLWDHTS
jgi:hypothetical protein